MKWYWWVLGGVVILIIVVLLWPTPAPQSVQQSGVSTTTQVASSTKPVATSTPVKSVPKQINASPVWTQYLKAYACVETTLGPKAHSFRQEGTIVAIGAQKAYRCNDGGIWVY